MNRIRDFINLSLQLETIDLSGSSSSSSDDEDMRVNLFEAFIEGTAFNEYIERFNAFAELHGVDNPDKTTLLVSSCGAYLYSKMCSVCSPRKPADVSFEDLVQLLEESFCPKKLEVVERSKFFSRNQRAGENASVFAMALRDLAKTCNFGENLNSQLRDKFIMGIKEDATRAKIIQASPKTVEEAVALAETFEISETTQSSSSNMAHRFSSSYNRSSNMGHQRNSNIGHQRTQRQVYRQKRGFNSQHYQHTLCRTCGKPLYVHRNMDCPAKKYRCHDCGNIGHIASCCPHNLHTERNDEKKFGSIGERVLQSGRKLGPVEDDTLHLDTDEESL